MKDTSLCAHFGFKFRQWQHANTIEFRRIEKDCLSMLLQVAAILGLGPQPFKTEYSSQ